MTDLLTIFFQHPNFFGPGNSKYFFLDVWGSTVRELQICGIMAVSRIISKYEQIYKQAILWAECESVTPTSVCHKVL
jgi:hypothetical protein